MGGVNEREVRDGGELEAKFNARGIVSKVETANPRLVSLRTGSDEGSPEA